MDNEEAIKRGDSTTVTDLLKKFLAQPETVLLYRGEGIVNKKGLHFTADREWAKNFGVQIFQGSLPAKSKIKVLETKDFDNAWSDGVNSEMAIWNHCFDQGYDAILGIDAMNDQQIDVIVNPKNLEYFKLG